MTASRWPWFASILAAILARLVQVAPAPTRPVILVVGATQLALAVVAGVDFFWAPALFNALAAGCCAIAVASTLRGGAARSA